MWIRICARACVCVGVYMQVCTESVHFSYNLYCWRAAESDRAHIFKTSSFPPPFVRRNNSKSPSSLGASVLSFLRRKRHSAFYEKVTLFVENYTPHLNYTRRESSIERVFLNKNNTFTIPMKQSTVYSRLDRSIMMYNKYTIIREFASVRVDTPPIV